MRLRRAHQFHPTIALGDAVGSDCFELQRLFWQRGVASDVFASDAMPGAEPFVRPWQELWHEARRDAALLVHVSMGNPSLSEVPRLPQPKAVIYHNITPARFFEGVSERLLRESERGRRQLADLARVCELGIGDSEFNRRELEALGFAKTAVVPILLDPGSFAATPDPALLRELAEERTTILVVGQILPQKATLDVLAAFARYRQSDPAARLYLVGSHSLSPGYVARVRDAIRERGLEDSTTLAGSVSSERLAAYYHGATVLLTLSDHEGFCAPLVEAMHAGLPIVAHSAGAIPDTLGDAGLLLGTKTPEAVAAALERAVGDERLRRDLVERGRRRLVEFSPERVAERLGDALALAGWELPQVRRRRVTVVSSDQRCGIHHYALAVCDGLRANGHDVTFVGVRHLDDRDLRTKLSGIAPGTEAVLIEHEAGIFRDVPFVRALLSLWRRRFPVVLSLHELEPEKFHHYRMLSAALHYRPRYPWPLELARIPWVAARIAGRFIRYRVVLGAMGSIPRRTVVHSARSAQWLDLLTSDAGKRDLFPLVVMPLEDTSLPADAEQKRVLRDRLGLPTDRFVFVSPGFFFPRKRFIEVIRALPDDAVLVLSGTRSAGNPEYFDEVTAVAKEKPNVIVNTDYDSMGEFVAASDCVVLYYEDVFQSAVAAQSVWAGLPCIFSAAGGFRLFHSAGLVARGDGELGAAMAEVRDPQTYERLRRGAGVLRRMLSPERLAPRYLVGLADG